MQKWNARQIEPAMWGAAIEAPKDLVSICVSAYNYENFCPCALQSVAAQTHQCLELIVVDDCSDRDATFDVVARWLDNHHHRFWRTRLVSNRRNQGPSFTRNVAFDLAAGQYVFVLDADNEIYPRAIAELYSVATRNDAAATYSQIEMFGTEHRLGSADVFDIDRLRAGNYIDVMALIKREVWSAVGGFSHLELGWEDYDFWLKFAEAGYRAVYVPQILCRYRLHGGSRTDKDALPAHEALRNIFALRHPVSSSHDVSPVQ